MLYFANPCGAHAGVRAAMLAGQLGFIDTPRQRNHRPAGVTWCADNGCFSDAWDAARWWDWLVKHADSADSCAFAVAPDVVGDALATLERGRPWLYPMRRLGYPVAYAAQDGFEDVPAPWSEFDVLFLGGSTEWKLSHHARAAVTEAKARGKRVHMGRVNSCKRYELAKSWGCDSVDGTFLVFGPDRNLPQLLSWIGVPA